MARRLPFPVGVIDVGIDVGGGGSSGGYVGSSGGAPSILTSTIFSSSKFSLFFWTFLSSLYEMEGRK